MAEIDILSINNKKIQDVEARKDIQVIKENQINLIEDDTSMEGISDTVHDTLETDDKRIIGGINEVNAKLKDIANLSLVKHTDGKVYIKKQDGTLIGDGIEIGGSDVDLSKISMSMSGQTLKLMNDGTQIATVEIPTAVVTDEQLTSIIQAKIDDGTLTSLALGENSVSTTNIQDKSIIPNKTNFFKEEYPNLLHGKEWTNTGYSGDDQSKFGSQFYVSDYVETTQNVLYTISPKMSTTYGGPYIGKMGCYDANKTYLGMATITNGRNVHKDNVAGHRWIEEFTLLDNTKYVRIAFSQGQGADNYNISETNRKSAIISYTEVNENTDPNQRIFTVAEDYLQNLIDAILIDKSVTSNKLSDVAIKEQFKNNVNNNKILDYTHMKMFDMVENTENLFTGIIEDTTTNDPIDSTVNTDSYGFQTFLTDFIDINSNTVLCVGLSTVSTTSNVNLFSSIRGVFCFDENKKYLGKATIENVDSKNTTDESGNYVSMYLRWRIKNFIKNTKYVRFGFSQTYITRTEIENSCIIRKTLPNFNEDAKLISLKMAEHYKLEGTSNSDSININLPLANKKVVWIGDSLTNWGGGDGTIGGTGFLDIIKTNDGVDIYNQGTAGASWEYGLGTWDETHTTYTPVEGEKYTAIGRVTTLIENKDTFIPDYVVFMMGSNRRADGETTDEYTNLHTMCGAIKHCLLQIYKNFPGCAIGVVLPPQRQEGMDAQEQVNEKIKTIANYYSVPTFDAFHEGGLLNHERNPLVSTVNSGGFSDGLHLSELGMKTLGRKFSHWLKTL